MVGLLRAAGKRVTQERRAVLAVLEANPHLEAAEIFEHAVGICSRINLSTVYRTLSLLHSLGVVEATGFGESHRHFESHHTVHYHAVCQSCGAVLELPPTSALAKLAEAEGFTVVEERVELVGVCRSCRRKKRKTIPVHKLASSSPRSGQRVPVVDEFAKLRRGGSIELVARDDHELRELLAAARKTDVRLTHVRMRSDGTHLWMEKAAKE